MLIGELAAKTGLSRDTRLLSVVRLKNFGFTLNEIGDLLADRSNRPNDNCPILTSGVP
jgi:DNA-binding transcriptional MerR regulator